MENTYKRWSSESDIILEKLYKTSDGINEIAARMGRTKGAIISRLSKLLSREAESLSLDDISKKYGRTHQEIQELINTRWNIETKPEAKEQHDKDKSLIKKLEDENRLLEAKIKNIQLKIQLKNLCGSE